MFKYQDLIEHLDAASVLIPTTTLGYSYYMFIL